MKTLGRSSSLKQLSGVAVALLLSAALAACGSDALGPFQPQISNAADNFQLQATNVTAVTTTLSYSWTNSGTRATVDHSTTTTAGSTLLVIKDGSGATVYSKALVPSLNEPTTAGQAGTWSIQLTLTNYSGTLNFRAQKL
jgi:hypothetical protein